MAQLRLLPSDKPQTSMPMFQSSIEVDGQRCVAQQTCNRQPSRDVDRDWFVFHCPPPSLGCPTPRAMSWSSTPIAQLASKTVAWSSSLTKTPAAWSLTMAGRRRRRQPNQRRAARWRWSLGRSLYWPAWLHWAPARLYCDGSGRHGQRRKPARLQCPRPPACMDHRRAVFVGSAGRMW